MFVKFLRFLKGYVKFNFMAPDNGRFIYEASFLGKLRNVSEENGVITAECDIKTYRLLKDLTKNLNGKRKIIKKVGVPFLLYKHKNRKGVFIGFFIMLTLIIVLSRFIWSVDVSGGDELLRQNIRNSLPDYGIKTGILKSKIDNRTMGNSILTDYPEISFISINIQGNRVVVEIDNTDPKPTIPLKDSYANIVARKEGKIVVMETYQGDAVKKVDDYVYKGELLVSGTKEDYFGRIIYMNSSAKVIAETEMQFELRLPMREEAVERTGKHIVKRYLRIFNLNIPLHLHFFQKGDYETEASLRDLKLFGVSVPLSFVKLDLYQTETVNREYSVKEVRNNILKLLEDEKKTLLYDKELISETTYSSVEDGYYVLTVHLVVREDIAKHSLIEVEN